MSGLSRGYTPQTRKSDTPARILTIDIETAPMLAYAFQPKVRYITPDKVVAPSRMLSFAAKWYGRPQVEFFSEFHDSVDAMNEGLFSLLDQADIVVGYNSERFDVPKIRTALLLAGFPPMRPFKQIDLIRPIRSHFSFPYNRLDEVAGALGVGRKTTHQGFKLWADCLAGDEKAWNKMRTYNKRDVVITERVLDRLRGFIPNLPNLGLYDPEPRIPCCPSCGSKKLTEAGTARTAMTGYGMFRCDNCGAYSRNNFIKERISRRNVR